MNVLFHETFGTVSDGLPGGWYVENNSNLKAVPAIRSGENFIELLFFFFSIVSLLFLIIL